MLRAAREPVTLAQAKPETNFSFSSFLYIHTEGEFEFNFGHCAAAATNTGCLLYARFHVSACPLSLLEFYYQQI